MYQGIYSYVESRLEELKASNYGIITQAPHGATVQFRELAGDALISLGKRIKPKSASARHAASDLKPSWAGR